MFGGEPLTLIFKRHSGLQTEYLLVLFIYRSSGSNLDYVKDRSTEHNRLAHSAINYARCEVSRPPDFDQSADVYCGAFSFHTPA